MKTRMRIVCLFAFALLCLLPADAFADTRNEVVNNKNPLEYCFADISGETLGKEFFPETKDGEEIVGWGYVNRSSSSYLRRTLPDKSGIYNFYFLTGKDGVATGATYRTMAYIEAADAASLSGGEFEFVNAEGDESVTFQLFDDRIEANAAQTHVLANAVARTVDGSAVVNVTMSVSEGFELADVCALNEAGERKLIIIDLGEIGRSSSLKISIGADLFTVTAVYTKANTVIKLKDNTKPGESTVEVNSAGVQRFDMEAEGDSVRITPQVLLQDKPVVPAPSKQPTPQMKQTYDVTINDGQPVTIRYDGATSMLTAAKAVDVKSKAAEFTVTARNDTFPDQQDGTYFGLYTLIYTFPETDQYFAKTVEHPGVAYRMRSAPANVTLDDTGVASWTHADISASGKYDLRLFKDGGEEPVEQIACDAQDTGADLRANLEKHGKGVYTYRISLLPTEGAPYELKSEYAQSNPCAPYTIAYDTDGGGEIDPASYWKGEAVTLPPEPTKADYTFAGWTWSCGEQPSAMPAEHLTATAVWKPITYTVNYVTGVSCPTQIGKIEYALGSTVTLPNDPIHEDLIFDGWIWSCGVQPRTMPAENLTATAKWKRTIWSILYDTNGGKIYSPVFYREGEEVVLPEEPTREGFVFDGWTWSCGEQPKTMPADDLTATARWIAVHTITFDTDGGSAIAPASYAVGDAVALPENPTKADFVFVGWTWSCGARPATMPAENLTATAKWEREGQKHTIFYTVVEGQVIKSVHRAGEPIDGILLPGRVGYTFVRWVWDTPDGMPLTVMPYRDVYLYAEWKPMQYTITYVSQSRTVATQTYDYGAEVVLPEKPSRSGAEFVCWTWDCGEQPATMPSKNVVATAVWYTGASETMYTITYYLYETENGVAILTQTYAAGEKITPPTPTNPYGWPFERWDWGAAGMPAAMPASDLEVYAMWQWD